MVWEVISSPSLVTKTIPVSCTRLPVYILNCCDILDLEFNSVGSNNENTAAYLNLISRTVNECFSFASSSDNFKRILLIPGSKSPITNAPMINVPLLPSGYTCTMHSIAKMAAL